MRGYFIAAVQAYDNYIKVLPFEHILFGSVPWWKLHEMTNVAFVFHGRIVSASVS
jgi:hypothetical protein